MRFGETECRMCWKDSSNVCIKRNGTRNGDEQWSVIRFFGGQCLWDIFLVQTENQWESNDILAPNSNKQNMRDSFPFNWTNIEWSFLFLLTYFVVVAVCDLYNFCAWFCEAIAASLCVRIPEPIHSVRRCEWFFISGNGHRRAIVYW